MKFKLFLFGSGFLILFYISACKEIEDPAPEIKSKWKVFTTKDGLASDTIWSLMEDKSGTIWIGSGNGISIAENSSSEHFEVVDSGYKVNKINCVDDYVMLATNKGAFVFVDNNWYVINTIVKNCIDIELFDDMFWCLYEDEELFIDDYSLGVINGTKNIYVNGDDLWLCRLGGLYQYYPTKKVYSESSGMSSNLCFTMYQNANGTIWAGTFDKEGLSRITSNNIANFNCGYIGSIAEDQKGNMWFGSKYYGLYKLETNGNLKNYTMLDGLPNNKVTDILITKDSIVWIATEGGGIAKYENK